MEMMRMKTRKLETVPLNLALHVQTVRIEKEFTSWWKEHLRITSVTPPQVCDKGGASVCLQTNKVLEKNSTVKILL